ncbi:MAG: ribonuclease P protein component [bacterium]
MKPFSFGAESRITRKKTFQELKKGGQVFKTANLIFNFRLSESGESRLGFIVTRKVGNAVFRNRVKRWFREIFRLNRQLLDPAVDLIIIPRTSRLNFFSIRRDFYRFADYNTKKNSCDTD